MMKGGRPSGRELIMGDSEKIANMIDRCCRVKALKRAVITPRAKHAGEAPQCIRLTTLSYHQGGSVGFVLPKLYS